MAQAASPMNGGDGTNSYAKNSTLQRDGLNAAKNVIKEALIQSLDLQTLLSNDSTTLRIADLGCSVGPNTFFAMETILETVEQKYINTQSSLHSSKKLEFHVFFNDQTSNDFNTLFASLPHQRKYFAAAVPGSFYSRLFPPSSIHLMYSSASLHWLSKVPEELQMKNSPAWNGGKIHYTGASEAVVRAYKNQFDKDMEVFLRARAEEIVVGGLIVMHMPGVPDGLLTHDVGIAISFLGSILMDLAKEGILDQEKVESLNIPHVYPSVKEMKRAVEKNGSFEIVKMELRNARTNVQAPIDMESAVMHLRALAEGTIANHLGNHTVDQLFRRALQQKNKLFDMLYSSGIEIGAQFFAVLKRKP